LIALYANEESLEVIKYAEGAFLMFTAATLCDWTGVNTSGIIKAVGLQPVISVCSFLCLLFVALPTSYITCFKLGWGLEGLFSGYGLSALVLSSIKFILLCRLDWKATALWASTNEDYSAAESLSSDYEGEASDNELALSFTSAKSPLRPAIRRPRLNSESRSCDATL
jgi:hypothetical protein